MAYDWIRIVYARSKAKGPAKAVLACLAFHADTDGTAFPSVDLLTDEIGFSRRTVIRALQELEEIGEVTRTGEYRGRTVVYRLTPPKVSERHSIDDEHSVRVTLSEPHSEDLRVSESHRQSVRVTLPNELSGNRQEDSSSLRSEGAAAPEQPSLLDDPPTLKEQVWGPCLAWLSRATNRPIDKLRPVVGRWLRNHDEGQVAAVMYSAARDGPVEPIAWIEQALRTRAGKSRHNALNGYRGQAELQEMLDGFAGEDCAAGTAVSGPDGGRLLTAAARRGG